MESPGQLFSTPERRNRLLKAVLASTVAICVALIPVSGLADLADDLEAAFRDGIDGLIGTEFEGLTVSGQVLGFESSPFLPKLSDSARVCRATA